MHRRISCETSLHGVFDLKFLLPGCNCRVSARLDCVVLVGWTRRAVDGRKTCLDFRRESALHARVGEAVRVGDI